MSEDDIEIWLLGLGVAFAALCVWLGVRIFNRRERWAKWTAVALAAVVAYPLSIGPVCWASSRLGSGSEVVSTVYGPLIENSREIASRLLDDYSQIGSPSYWCWQHVAIFRTADPDVETLGRRIAWESELSTCVATPAIPLAPTVSW
jgi:hypothetical protein